MLKRYKLICPVCNEENIMLPANEPESPFCSECNEEVNMDDLESMINAWIEYLQDRKDLLDTD